MGHQPALEDRSVSIAEHPARQPWQQGDIGMTPASDPKTSKLKETIEASSPPPSTETMRKTNSTCQHSYKYQAHVVQVASAGASARFVQSWRSRRGAPSTKRSRRPLPLVVAPWPGRAHRHDAILATAYCVHIYIYIYIVNSICIRS